MKVTTKYSGTSGLYACVTPVSGISEVLAKLTAVYPELQRDDSIHCTLMYSSEVAPSAIRAFNLLESGPKTYTALAYDIDYWPGHDNAGYLVIKLFSEELTARHNEWKRLGAKPSFSDYTPHITIAKGVELSNKQLETLRQCLVGCPIKIVFAAEHIEDIKP